MKSPLLFLEAIFRVLAVVIIRSSCTGTGGRIREGKKRFALPKPEGEALEAKATILAAGETNWIDRVLRSKRRRSTTRTYLNIPVLQRCMNRLVESKSHVKTHEQMSQLDFVICLLLGEIVLLQGELWEKDLSAAMKIGLSTSGYSAVDLRCEPDHFSVNVTLGEGFGGVVYTRGSFDDRKLPCFKTHREKTLDRSKNSVIALRIPFNDCGTVMDVDESCYTNTVVVQHDPDLIMPGDAAFGLDCSFVPEFKATGSLQVKESNFKSRITLVDADPSAEKTEAGDPAHTVHSKTDRATFVPNPPAKEEL